MAKYLYKEVPKEPTTVTPLSVSEKVLTPFWHFMAEKIPVKVTPNTISCTSLFLSTTGYCLSWFTDMHPTKPAPITVVILIIVHMFIYQCLDALDGIHARKTGQTSLKGAFMDHAIDTLVTFTQCHIGNIILQIPFGRNNLLVVLSAMIAFHMAHVEEAYTHVLPTSWAGFGVTEIQLFSLLLMLTAGIIAHFVEGAQIYSRIGLSTFATICTVYTVGNAITKLINFIRLKKSSTERRGDYIRLMNHICPLVIILIVALLIPEDMILKNARRWHLAFGSSMVALTHRLIYSNLTLPKNLTGFNSVVPYTLSLMPLLVLFCKEMPRYQSHAITFYTVISTIFTIHQANKMANLLEGKQITDKALQFSISKMIGCDSQTVKNQ